MTISSTVRVAGPFIGNGTASTFPFTFKVFAAADLDVIRLTSSTGVETTLVLNSDYSVALNGDQNTNPGGSITLIAGALASGFTLTITSDIANLQPTDLTNQGGFYPEVITDSLDRATIQIQQISDIGDRTLKIPISDGTGLTMELPNATNRANKYLTFDVTGEPTVSSGSGTDTALRTDLANNSVALAGASLVGFRQSSATSVARTVLTKLRESQSVTDYGAVGDGVADDTSAFMAAWTANSPNPVFIPGGSYAISGTITGTFITLADVTIVGGTVNTITRIGANATIPGTLTVTGTSTLTGNVTVGGNITVSGDGLFINSNALINGDFQVAQRGTSITSASVFANNDDAYALDRWYILSDGNDAIDVTQNTADAPFTGGYCIALDVETSNKKFGIAQIIEHRNCNGLLGQTVTLSFKAKVSSTTKLDNVKCAIVAWSGTVDTVTSDIISAWNVEGTNPTLVANATYENTPANLNVTTSWQKFTVTAAVDTASASNIIVFIWSDVTDTTTGDFLYVTDVKLEAGTLATPYPREEFSTSILRCQRYFVSAIAATGLSWHDPGNVYTSYASAGTGFFQRFAFRVPMRAAPTTTIVGTWSASNSNQPVPISFADTLTLSCAATAAGSAQTASTSDTGWHSNIEM